MIVWQLHVKMGERRLRIADLAKLTGLAPETISKYYHDKNVTAVEMETLNRLCKALDCEPGDLLAYVPDEKQGR